MEMPSDITPIENKVAASSLVTLNLEDYFEAGERVVMDIKPWLFHGLILKEKDFREHLSAHQWEQYSGKFVALTCSTDAIIPTWAFMLVTIQLQPYAKRVVFGGLQTLETVLFTEALMRINPEDFKDKRVIVKGCSDVPVPVSAYTDITFKLAPVVKSLMYGEACSNVPLMKRK